MFKNILRELRTLRNLKQHEVAALLNITRVTYTNYESGRREPNFTMLVKLANLFNVSVDYLLGNDNIAGGDFSKDEAALIKKYRSLPNLSKERVNNILNFEYEQCKPSIKHKMAT
jgi:transcriptional regulator with XRE-family HTH domain